MKIGFITPEYPHTKNKNKIGGIGTSLKNLVFQMAQKGHEITVFLYGMNEDNVYVDNNITTVFIKMPKRSFFSFYWNRKKVADVVNQYVENKRLDVVEAAEWSGITAFQKYKCKVVLRLHGSDTYFCHLENRKLKRFNYILEKNALKSADAIISVSQFTADLTNELFSITRKIQVIYNAIDLEKFKKNSDIDINKNMVLYFGTLIRKKGALDIPKIFNALYKTNPTAKLVLIGNDSLDYREKVSTWELMQKEFSKDALQSVEYKGAVAYEEMRANILKAKVCIFPSYAEAFPVSWLEAMACNKVVVASDIGWAPETIEDGISGLLCAPNEHQKYASLTKKVLEDDSFSKGVSEAARLRIEKLFSAEQIAEENIQFFRELVNKA